MKIMITGSLAFDFIMNFPGKFGDHILPEKIHEINLSFLVEKLQKQYGGTAGNIAYNLALLGFKPAILATAGNDFSEYKKFLENSGVDTSMIYIIEAEPTASAYIFTDMVDNQITGFYPGAMKYTRKLSINSALSSGAALACGAESTPFRSSLGGTPPRAPLVVISPNDPSAMIKFAKECQNLGIPYLFDPGMQLPRLKTQDLRLGIEGAKIVIGNDYEIALMAKRLGYRDIKRLGENKITITTLGGKGSLIETDGKTYKIPAAKPRKVLDPTGAGDAYRAGFLAGFLRGLPLKTCGKMGSIAAVYTVEKYGTTTHKFTVKEFKNRYQKNFREELKW